MNRIANHITGSIGISLFSTKILFYGLLISLCMAGTSWAQVSTAITPTTDGGNLGTTVTQTGDVYNITGGTRPENGTNLFHSFGEFSVGALDTARFLNTTPDLITSNILGRVTGSNPSSLFGTIDTLSYGGANLFLMNPAGIVFGPNASLNVSGSVTFTTANYLRLAEANGVNAGIFHADPGATSLLMSSPVVAFGFLGPNPAAIAIRGSNFSVPTAQAISLVGGNQGFTYPDPDTGNTASVPDGITITGGTLSAPTGQINMVSVASVGEVLASPFQPISGMTLGSISLGPDTLVDVSGDAAGTVRIRSGQFVMDNATISADTANSDGAPVAIDISTTGNVAISIDTTAALTARTAGTGDSGEIHVVSADLIATPDLTATLPSEDLSLAVIDTHTSGTGTAGNVVLATRDLMVIGDPLRPSMFIHSGTGGSGNGGSVTVTARNAQFARTGGINTGDSILFGTGSAGSIAITAESLTLNNASFSALSFNARGGNVALEGHNIRIAGGSSVDNLSLEGTSTVSIKADQFVLDGNSNVLNQTALGPGGGIAITARTVQATNNSTVTSQTFGDGDAGNISVTATEHVTLSDDAPSGFNAQPSGIFTNSFGDPTLGTRGNAGAIDITTPHLEITGGARINSTTQTSGRGGDVTIVASDKVTISGDRALDVASELFGLGGTRASGIYTRTVGSELCSGSCGNAGTVNITTGSLTLQNGGLIDSGTSNNGQGGNSTILATDQVLLSGTMTDGTPSGVFSRSIGTDPDAGSGGNIALTAGQSVTISNGATISASSTGPGNAGNIAVNAGQSLDLRDSSIKTEAAQASGGNIDIQAIDQVRLVNSTVSTSVLGGAGSGGNISIDPNVVVLQNSQVIAQAVQGAGGNITITTPLFLADSSSLVSASSQFGLNGTVTIQSPTSNLSESLGTLTSKPSQAQSLLTQRCAALANGQASSFVVAGREQLPADPGGWLTSPLALAGLEADPFKDGTVAEGTSNLAPRTSGLLASDRVSLRRLTPAGFLIANFADSEATGCHS
jgi:filamentous hemagglutinin family protein